MGRSAGRGRCGGRKRIRLPIAFTAGAVPQSFEIPNAGGSFSFTPVFVSSFVPALTAAALLALFGLLTRRPIRNLRVVAAVALVLSFYTPFTIPGAPAAMIAALLLMHVVAAVLSWAPSRRSPARGRSGRFVGAVTGYGRDDDDTESSKVTTL